MKKIIITISLLFCFYVTEVTAVQWQTLRTAGMEVYMYVPDTSPKCGDKRALMISLHGCIQTNENLKNLGNWKGTADEYGMVIALPDVPPTESKYRGCWDYYDKNHSRDNRNNDNLIKLAETLIKDSSLNIDKNQVYISGLSSGGGQTAVMSCLAPDVFAGIGINAGPTIGTGAFQIGYVATDRPTAESLCKRFAGGNQSHFEKQLTSVIHGQRDGVVAQGYGLLNAEVMASIYGAHNKSNIDVSKLKGCQPTGKGTVWSDEKGPRVSWIAPSELGHAWPAGSCFEGETSYVRGPGVNYPAYLTKFFFENNRRVTCEIEDSCPGDNQPPTLTLRGDTKIRLEVGDTFRDPGAEAKDPEEGDLTDSIKRTPPDPLDTSKRRTHELAYNVLDSQGCKATPVTRVVYVGKDCEAWSTSLRNHEDQGRAYSVGWFWKSYFATGTFTYLPGNRFTEVTLHQFSTKEPGKFYQGPCPE